MRNGSVPQYFVAADEKSSEPLSTATPKLIQVQGKTSSITSRAGFSRQLRLSKRRSTMVMEPTTRVMARTWMTSIPGNSHEDSLMAVAVLVASSHVRKLFNTLPPSPVS